jgi:hypothetical protein
MYADAAGINEPIMIGTDSNAITKAIQNPIDFILDDVVDFSLSFNLIFMSHDWMLILKLYTLVKDT